MPGKHRSDFVGGDNDKAPVLVQVMAWRWTSYKPLPPQSGMIKINYVYMRHQAWMS